MNFWNKEINLKDIKIWKNIAIGIIYCFSVILIIKFGERLIRLPFTIANEYNIEVTNVDDVSKLFPTNYSTIFIGLLLIAVLALPIYFLLGRVKKFSKNGELEFRGDDEQTSNKVTLVQNQKYTENGVKDIINSNDEEKMDEPEEERLINNTVDSQDKTIIELKCQNIKNKMQPLTLEVTKELYYHHKENISFEMVLEYVKQKSKYKFRRDAVEKNEKIARKIIDFLKNNDIIEADEGYDDKYYFTILGVIFMNYFRVGII